MSLTRLTITVALLIALSPLPGALAKPRADEESDKVVLSNDDVSVWFQGKKPMLKVFDGANESRSYKVFIKELVEIQGVGSRADEVATLRLAKAQEWNVTVDEGEENGTDAAKVTMRLSDVPRFLGSQKEMLGLPPEVQDRLQPDAAPAKVTLTFHVYADDTTATGANNATVNVTNYEVKWDLHVEDWPWVGESNRLAIRFQVQAGGFGNDTANHTDEGEEGVSLEGNESEPVGAVTWSESAVVIDGAYTNNTTVSSAKFESAGKDENGHSFLLVFGASGYDELLYDPSLVIIPGAEAMETGGGDDEDDGGIPGFELPLLAAGAVAAAAIAARRRKT